MLFYILDKYDYNRRSFHAQSRRLLDPVAPKKGLFGAFQNVNRLQSLEVTDNRGSNSLAHYTSDLTLSNEEQEHPRSAKGKCTWST